MSYRIFSRQVWQHNSSWPNGFEPLATPMDTCKTLAVCYDRDEAVEYCDERNHKWRKLCSKVRLGEATAKQVRTYFTSPRYEWTEV